MTLLSISQIFIFQFNYILSLKLIPLLRLRIKNKHNNIPNPTDLTVFLLNAENINMSIKQ